MTTIDDKYAALGGENGFLGAPVMFETPTPDGAGQYRHFQYGSIYWHPSTGAHEVHGAIRDKWASFGWEQGFMGYPMTDEVVVNAAGARVGHFQNASIYFHPDTGAYEMHGSIRDKWQQLGLQTSLWLGVPITDETPTPDGAGRYNHFEFGSIYWHPDTGAFEVHGAIRDKWAALGWEQSVLGYPVTDETPAPDGAGRYNHFQFGSIYWHPTTGAFEVHGAIRDRWVTLGWERSLLGYPVTDETPTPTGLCRFNHFQHGSIYWSAETGAHETLTAVRLHIKVLTPPGITLNEMLDSMQQVYLTAGVRVDHRSTENLDLPYLNDVEIGQCVSGKTTVEQQQLFGHRNGVGANETVVYFVNTTVPPANGCAAHPPGQPGAVVAHYATRWTLGHEAGHVLGLYHVNDNDRLMTGNGTFNITNPPPDLIASEIKTMDNSPFTINL